MESKYIKHFAFFYCVCFLANCYWYHSNDLMLHQISPTHFINKLDITTNILLATGIPALVVKNSFIQLFIDILYSCLPILFLVSVYKNKFTKLVSIASFLVNLIYSLLLSIFTFISPEPSLGWVLIPLLFFTVNSNGFAIRLQTLRYLFILFFISAALWKVVSGGILVKEEMSSILIMQHKAILISTSFYSSFIYYLINNPAISYLIYLLAFFLELSFVIGFFTKKYDKFLLWFLLLFIVADLIVMRINYFGWIGFCGLFYYSFKIDSKKL